MNLFINGIDVPDVGKVRFHLIANSKGGNCLYESIAQALGGSRTFQDVRVEVADAIIADAAGSVLPDAELQHLLTSGEENYRSLAGLAGRNLREAIATGNRGTLPGVGFDWWGDALTLQYAARRYHTRFIILGGSTSNSIEPPFPVSTVVLRYWQDNHYELMEIEIPGEPRARMLWASPAHRRIVQFLLNRAGGGICRGSERQRSIRRPK